MFKLVPSERTGLEKARDEALTVLNGFDPVKDKEEYATTVTHIKTLSKLIAEEAPSKLNVNTVILVAANLFIALKVVKFEDTNVVTTKVLPFLMKSI